MKKPVNKAVATPQEVREALARYLDNCAMDSKEPDSEVYLLVQAVEKQLGIDWESLRPGEVRGARRLLDQQVRRALEKLVGDGALVKRGGRGELRYCTPAASARLDQREQEEAERAGARREQAVALVSRLGALGVTAAWDGSWVILLPLNGCEKVLALAEAGERRRMS